VSDTAPDQGLEPVPVMALDAEPLPVETADLTIF
jgi:hypothetical protein